MSVDAAQAALAGEHATIYAYGVAGANLDGATRARALHGLTSHRAARDVLAAVVREHGAEPVGPLAGYALPFRVRGARAARRLLGQVEARLADVYGDLVASGSGSTRALAVSGLANAAEQAAVWGGRTDAFPGFVRPPA